ncbi:dihydroorotate dehydrogenase [Ramlibacter rhizophilus]|uniref:Dihydroorotate dehydrogenase n=1 Tax=Ramlibacter rhizophilus TaxID=1781167 RepID=A0A4Z0BDX3_9BURK|nr:dihydroorotate dehydrogenase [Ramlibacter rhizophilus]TFY97492.1 dihydroorotate dehydrogenase [Ramlibacter rhizophilus]
MSTDKLRIRAGGLDLKNPVIAGSGEATMTADGIRAALRAGVGAVIAKSANESQGARDQLNHTDYLLFDSRWNPLPWNDKPPPDAQLFCRSGLQPQPFDQWVETLATVDREARAMGSYVVGSLILNNVDECIRMAREMEQAGLPAIDVLVAAVHGEQAARGAIAMVRDTQGVTDVVSKLRAAVKIPLWIKLPGQVEDVSRLAEAATSAGADAVNFIDRTLAMVPDIETRAPFLGTIAAIGGSWSLAVTCRWLAYTRKRLGADCHVIGTNGCRDGYDVVRMLLAGARAAEMTSAVMVQGPQILRQSIEELSGYLDRHGVTVEQIVGEAADKLTAYTDQPSRPGYWQNFIHPESRSPSTPGVNS